MSGDERNNRYVFAISPSERGTIKKRLGLLTIWLLPVDGGARIWRRRGEYNLAAYAVPVRWRRRGVVDGPQYRVDERV